MVQRLKSEVQTFEKFFEPKHFENPEEPGRKQWTSEYGVQLPNGSIVTVTNGTLCIQGPNNTPDSVAHDAYIADVLDGVNEPGCQLVQFDRDTLRYKPIGDQS